MQMTEPQTSIAVPLLNSYAHEYLGINHGAVAVAGALVNNKWVLIVATPDEAQEAEDFDAAKAMVDAIHSAPSPTTHDA